MTHILVIDDDASIRALVRQILEAEGHYVSEAADGEVGMTLLRAQPAALVITDIFMPGQEGIQTILEARKYFPRVKLLAISGGAKNFAMKHPLPEVRRFGAHHTLAKPFTAQELLDAVRTVLAQ
jgi:DNA-binding response OmpR family regulator